MKFIKAKFMVILRKSRNKQTIKHCSIKKGFLKGIIATIRRSKHVFLQCRCWHTSHRCLMAQQPRGSSLRGSRGAGLLSRISSRGVRARKPSPASSDNQADSRQMVCHLEASTARRGCKFPKPKAHDMDHSSSGYARVAE